MKLPIVMPDVRELRFDCHRCTECCRSLVVQLTESDRAKIDAQNWGGRLGAMPYVRLGRHWVLNHVAGGGPLTRGAASPQCSAERSPRVQGGCVFLREDGACRIHAEHGAEAKPLACRLYPFTFDVGPDLIQMGLRFDCPSVARGKGRAIGVHREEVVELVRRLGEEMGGAERLGAARGRMEISAGRAVSAEVMGRVMGAIERRVGDGKLPPAVRLAGLADAVQTMAGAKLERVGDEAMDELFGMVLEDAIATAPGAMVRAGRPAARQMVLFRQAVFGHCEHVGLAEARAGLVTRLRHRMGQLQRGRRFAAGLGEVPGIVKGRSGGPLTRGEHGALHCGEAAPRVKGVRFEEVDRVGVDSGGAMELEEALDRYVRARLASRTVMGGGYYGFALLDGLRALLIAVAAAGWLARYAAAREGRASFGVEDLVFGLGVVDRAAGRSPELGTRPARLRGRYLGERGGIVSLLKMYGVEERAG